MFSTYYHTVYDKALYSPDGGLETLAHPGLCTFCLKRVNKLIVIGKKKQFKQEAFYPHFIHRQLHSSITSLYTSVLFFM